MKRESLFIRLTGWTTEIRRDLEGHLRKNLQRTACQSLSVRIISHGKRFTVLFVASQGKERERERERQK